MDSECHSSCHCQSSCEVVSPLRDDVEMMQNKVLEKKVLSQTSLNAYTVTREGGISFS